MAKSKTYQLPQTDSSGKNSSVFCAQTYFRVLRKLLHIKMNNWPTDHWFVDNWRCLLRVVKPINSRVFWPAETLYDCCGHAVSGRIFCLVWLIVFWKRCGTCWLKLVGLPNLFKLFLFCFKMAHLNDRWLLAFFFLCFPQFTTQMLINRLTPKPDQGFQVQVNLIPNEPFWVSF